jgi:hypothetical protein
MKAQPAFGPLLERHGEVRCGGLQRIEGVSVVDDLERQVPSGHRDREVDVMTAGISAAVLDEVGHELLDGEAHEVAGVARGLVRSEPGFGVTAGGRDGVDDARDAQGE